MSELNDKTIALPVRLKLSDLSAHPRVANYTNLVIAQGVAHLGFGFIEPVLLATIAKTAKNGEATPKGVDGHLVTRVALDIATLVRLQQHIQQALSNMGIVRKTKATGSE